MIHYSLIEELPAGTLIGSVVQDGGFEQKYPHEIVRQLRFQYLTAPTADFAIDLDEENGVLRTPKVIDRDVICPQMISCKVQLDIAVLPVEYFQI